MADILLDVKVVGTQDVLKVQTAMAQVEREARKLSASMNQGKLTNQAYFKGQTQLVAILTKVGVSYKEAQRAVFGYTKAQKAGVSASSSFGNAVQGATKKQSKFGVVAQQTGYQVGDFLVQIQSGANPMMAFGQQATQLVGVMSLFGGKLLYAGAALGIVIPLATALAGAWLRSRDSAKESARSLDSYAGSLDVVKDSFKELEKQITSSLENIDKKLKASRLGVSEEEISFIDKLTVAQQKYTDALENLNSERSFLLKGGFSKKEMEELLLSDTQAMKAAREEASLASAEYERFKALRTSLLAGSSLSPFGGEGDPAYSPEGLARAEEFRETVSRIRGLMGEVSSEATVLTQYVSDVASELGLGYKEALKLQEEMKAVEGYALGTTEADMEAGIIAAAAAAAVLAENMGISLGLALDLVALAGKSKAENAFDAGIKTGAIPPQAAGDFNLETGNKPNTFLKSYMDRVDQRVKDRASAARGGGGGSKAEARDPLAELVKRIELDTKLLGVSESRAEVMRKLGDDASKYNQEEIDAVVKRLDAYSQEKEALELVQSTQQSIADTLKSSMSEAFMSMVDGTKSFKDAMKDMAKSVIKQLFDILVVQRLVGSWDRDSGKGTGLVGAIMGALPFANGGAFSGGHKIQAYADGGVVGGPTMFPMSGGKTGLMGEAGPEAIMPLKRGKNGKLGVETSGSGSVVVNNNFNVSANGDDSVKRIIQSQMPKISEATKRAVVDSKRRGGSYGRSF